MVFTGWLWLFQLETNPRVKPSLISFADLFPFRFSLVQTSRLSAFVDRLYEQVCLRGRFLRRR